MRPIGDGVAVFANRECRMRMALRPQDLVVSLELLEDTGPKPSSYSQLAAELAMSPAEVHAAVRRATHAGLLGPNRRANASALFEFIVHGVRYAFAPERGRMTRGIPTAHAAPPLDAERADDEPPPV